MIPEIIARIKDYFDFRGQVWPDGENAMKFAITELGEVVDAELRNEEKWVRNNPDKVPSVENEFGDLYQMLQIACFEKTGLTLEECMTKKWATKGYSEKE